MLKFGGRRARARHVSHHTIALQHHFGSLVRHPWMEMVYSYPPQPIADTIKDKLPEEVLKTAFSDDLSLTIKSKTTGGGKKEMQRILLQMEKRSNETGLRSSTEKTKAINFSKVTLYKKKIEEVCSHRFLGVIIDRSLSWVPHLMELKSVIESYQY